MQILLTDIISRPRIYVYCSKIYIAFAKLLRFSLAACLPDEKLEFVYIFHLQLLENPRSLRMFQISVKKINDAICLLQNSLKIGFNFESEKYYFFFFFE